MKPSKSVPAGETDALGGDLRPSEPLPRPIPSPPENPIGSIGG
jgi:hypothetical protein